METFLTFLLLANLTRTCLTLRSWSACVLIHRAVGRGGELGPGGTLVSGQSLRTPNLHTHPKSQSAETAIGLTADVIEPAEPRRPRALAGAPEWQGFGSLKTVLGSAS
ncbi:unnamed protein product [Pleuronectes platessa]|uniref:Secreted protein n=1 Tax=Pleuronectes platessa TaxID=8262 RepID=A0A9N7TVB4_PLEPL|nr:unnamed protein product [Pleuronectes platessa]